MNRNATTKIFSSRRASTGKAHPWLACVRRGLSASVLALLCLLNSLPAANVSAALAQSAPTGDQAIAAVEGETWFTTWTATAEGNLDGPYGDGGRIIRTRKITMAGSGVSRYAEGSSGTDWTTSDFSWTVTDDLFEQTTEPCKGGTILYRERQSIIDPQRDPEWVDDFLIPGSIFEREDGSKYMLGFWFVHNTDVGMPEFTYQDDRFSQHCTSAPNSDTDIEIFNWYAGIIWWEAYKGGLHMPDLECDDTATSCWWDYSFTSDRYSDMPMRVEWSVRSRRLPDSPSIAQKPELLESNVFLPGVSVSDEFEGHLDCDKNATCRAVRQLDTPGGAGQRETIGPSPSGNYPKTIDLGTLPPGQSMLKAQAEGVIPSPPDTRQILVAAELPKWAAGLAGIIARKVGNYVSYVWEVKFPEPAIKKLYDVPSFVPFIGGKKAGAELPQGALKTEAKSTGEVGIEGATGGAIVVGDSSIGVNITGKANGVLDLRGVKDVKGEAEFKVFGKVTAEEPLLKAVPALRPAVAAIQEFSPAVAKWIEDRAKAILEIEPNWSSSFTFSDKTGDIEIDSAVITPGIGIKVKALLKIVEEVAEIAVGIGGEIKAAFPTPPLSLKEVSVNFAILVDAVIYHFGVSTQAGYACTFPGACQAVGTDPGVMTAANGQLFYLPSRAYLESADYSRWAADENVQAQAANAAAANEIVDIELVSNIFPQAHPTLARNGTTLMLSWSHDAPGKPATGAQELHVARRTGSTWTTPAAITNDSVADFNRELVIAPDGDVVAVWHRFDSGTPGDMNTDPLAYLSHVQVGASAWNGTSWSAPVQLSTSGSLNQRPSLAAIDTGAMVVWIGNAGNQIIGDATNPDTVFFALYDDNTGTWNAAAPVLNNVEGLLGVRLAARGDKAAMVYSRDTDGDFATDTDRELYYVLWNGSWAAPVRLTNNSLPDELPQLVLTADGNPQLVWQQGETLRFLNGTWNNASAQALPFTNPGYGLRLVNDTSTTSTRLALTWEEVTALDTRVGYAIYDDTQNAWSNPQTLAPAVTGTVTGTSSMVTHISPVLQGEKLLVAYQVAEVTVTTMDVEGVTIPNVPQSGKHALRFAEIPLAMSATIYPAEITVTPMNAAPGAQVTIAARIHNTGQLATTPTTVELLKSADNSEISQPLPVIRGGESVTVTFNYVQPALGPESEAGTLKIVVDPNWDLDEDVRTDNTAFVSSVPLFTTLATYNTPLGPQVGAIFTQQGALQGGIAVTATLHLDSPDGPVVGEAHAGFPETPVSPSVTTTVVLDPEKLGAGTHLIHWVGAHGTFGVTAAHVAADLALEAESVTLANGQISVLVVNRGNQESTGGFIVIYDRPPGTPGAVELARLPLAAIAAGKFATVVGALNLGNDAAVYVQLEAASNSPDLNPANNIYVLGNFASGQPGQAGASLYFPMLGK